jgi:protein-export membrane protein SecD
MLKIRFIAVLLLLAGLGIGYYDYTKNIAPKDQEPSLFKLGLDLSGGVYLEYLVDVSSIPEAEVQDNMAALRDLIEARVNVFGVAEPIVQTKLSGVFGGAQEQRLVVQIPGVNDIEKAKAAIGAIPVLEFKELRPEAEVKAILAAKQAKLEALKAGKEYTDPLADEDIEVVKVSGKNLTRAELQFDGSNQISGGNPIVALQFDEEGAQLFAELTKNNAGKTIPIYVDGIKISEPTVSLEFAKTGITGGKAIITGRFTVQEAKALAGRLNSGALPVKSLKLVESQVIGATLGEQAVHAGVKAGIFGLIMIALFLIVWYRLPGIIAVISLGIYVTIILAIFKLMPVTLTAAGIAGFILSMGMAVDANILIFERMKEELKGGRVLKDAINEGFLRAWPSIRDGNLSSLITTAILFWFGSSLVQGFALTFGVGVLVSLFSAIVLSRTLLRAIAPVKIGRFGRVLFGSGVHF